MSPEQNQLLDNLRAIAQKKDPGSGTSFSRMGLLGCAVGLVAAVAWLLW